MADLAQANYNGLKLVVGEDVFEVGFVRSTTGASLGVGTAAEFLLPSMPVYIDDDGLLRRATASGTEEEAECVGLALNVAYPDQPVVYISDGDLIFKDLLVEGETYVLSANAGFIAPEADLVDGSYLTHIGYAKTTMIMRVEVRPRRVLVTAPPVSGNSLVSFDGDVLVTWDGDRLVTW